MNAHPYRDAPPVDLGDPPSCDHMLSAETRLALNAIGGWCHTEECVAWWRELQRQSPKDPRLAEFLKTCNGKLRATFS